MRGRRPEGRRARSAALDIRPAKHVTGKESGSARFDIFQQGSRPNHFTVVEVWKSQAAYDSHIIAAHTKAYRDQLTPMSGALYDERLYHAI